jgi:hypothetical protein
VSPFDLPQITVSGHVSTNDKVILFLPFPSASLLNIFSYGILFSFTGPNCWAKSNPSTLQDSHSKTVISCKKLGNNMQYCKPALDSQHHVTGDDRGVEVKFHAFYTELFSPPSKFNRTLNLFPCCKLRWSVSHLPKLCLLLLGGETSGVSEKSFQRHSTKGSMSFSLHTGLIWIKHF